MVGGTLDGNTVIESRDTREPVILEGTDSIGTRQARVLDGNADTIAGYDTFDPTAADASGTTGSNSGTRKRGRPRGSTNSQGKTAQNPLEGLESLLFSVHMMGATILATPELVLSQKESDDLAKALQKVAQFYPVNIAPKTMAWVNLAMVAGAIYGTRYVAVRNRYKKDARPNLRVMQSQQQQAPPPQQQFSQQQTTAAQNKPNGKVAEAPRTPTPSDFFGVMGPQGDYIE